jgi:predicted RND superfamily exporter protein
VEGALVGPQQRDAFGRTLGNDSRVTCLIVDLSPEALADSDNLRAAVAGIYRVAATECGIDAAKIHLGGPPIDRATIDAEGSRILLRLAPVAGLIGLTLCYWRLGSAWLTAIVFGVGVASAAASLAIVFYVGAFEVLMLQRPAPQWGVLDAVVMALPAVIFLIAISAALHAANYYLQARHVDGMAGAAENMVRRGLRPTLIAAMAAALALAAFTANDIVPIQRFGLLAAVSIAVTAALVYGVMPMLVHRYPLAAAAVERRARRVAGGRLAAPLRAVVAGVVARPLPTCALGLAVLVALGMGLTRLGTSVQVLKLLDPSADLIRDYAWLEQHIGHLVPMEVVLTMPPERLRSGDEHAEGDGQQYRLTMLERLELLRKIGHRLEAFPQISRAMSAATFAPPATSTGLGGADRGGDYAKNKALEFFRERFFDGDYLQMEKYAASNRETGRELWRLNARVAALPTGEKLLDYGVLLSQMQRAVEPVLLACQQRDQIVRALHEQGKQLAGSRVCVLFRAPGAASAPPAEVQEQALAELLTTSGVAPRGVTYFNLATFERPERGDDVQNDAYRKSAIASLQKQDAVVLASAPSDPIARQIAESGVYVVSVADVHNAIETTASPIVDDGGPRPIRAVFTGLAPVVDRTQRELAASLAPSLKWAAAFAAGAVTLGYMSIASGALVLGASLLPLAATLGVMGWLGLRVNLGVAITAGLAIGVALEGTMHVIQWYRRGLAGGLPRRDAVIWGYQQSAVTLAESVFISAAVLATFAFSAFAPLREFAALMSVMQVATLAGNLLVLPAILASPLGWFFAPVHVRRDDPLLPKLQAWWESLRQPRTAAPGAVLPLPHTPAGPHYGVPAAPTRRTTLPTSTDEHRELAEGPHAALHAKLKSLRRPRAGDSAAS